MITREEIWKFQEKIRQDRERVVNPSWIRMYEQLQTALDHFDACIARSTVTIAESNETVKTIEEENK